MPEQIFSMDENSLFWRQKPERIFIHREAKAMSGLKSFKGRITALIGGNVAGFKLKHFVVCHSEHPRAFKYINKHTVPVHYRSHQ